MAILKKTTASFNQWFNKYSPAFVKKYKLPLLSGILLGTGFIPFPVFTVFFCWVPLWFFITQQKNIKSVLIGSWTTQFLATSIGFSWVIYTAHKFGGFNWFISFVAFVFFCAFANIFITLASIFWFFLTKNLNKSIALKLILLPVVFSLFHTIIPAIFPWNMGYNWLWAALPAAHTAEIWGFKFLNTSFYLFNLLLLILYKHRWDFVGKLSLSSALILFFALNGFGWYLHKRLPPTDKSINVLVVQHNIGNLRNLKYSAPFTSAAEKSLHQLKNITVRDFLKYKKRKEKIDFILWPEGAYPYILREGRTRLRKLSLLVKKMKTPLLTGLTTRRRTGYSNSLVTLNKRGKIAYPIYHKNKLLAFGETLPGSQTFPFIKKLTPYFHTNLVPGSKLQVKNLDGVNLGLQICYESLFDGLSRELALQGAQVLVNVTNDSWYNKWQQPWQHFTMSLARSLETRRPFIRSTNTGISTVITGHGALGAISPTDRSWSNLYAVPYYSNPPKTLFMSWGFYINEIFLFFLFVFGFAISRLKIT